MYNKKQANSGIILFLLVVSSWNGSLMDSESKDKHPDLNVMATIEDHVKTFSAEEVLIGGKYEQVPFFETIDRTKLRRCTEKCNSGEKIEQVDPKQNKILIDLKNVACIEQKHTDHPEAAKININNRDYIEVTVTLKHGKPKPYLIEASKKITCVEIEKGSTEQKPIKTKRELSFIHIKKITITGVKSIQEIECEQKCHCDYPDEKEVKKKSLSQ